MSKKYNISWRESDYRLLQQKVRNYNRKIDRLAKDTRYNDVILPERLSYAAVKANIQTRQQLNNYVNSLSRFTKRGSEKIVENKKGLKVTSWQRKEIAIKQGVINRRKAMALKNIEDPTKKGIMGRLQDQEVKLVPFDFDKREPKGWKKFVEATEKRASSLYERERAEKYKEFYIKMLKERLGSPAASVIELMESQDAELIYNAQFYDASLSVQFTTDPLEADMIAEEIELQWNNYIEEL